AHAHPPPLPSFPTRRSSDLLEHERSLSEVHSTVRVPAAASWIRRMFAFAGPAYLVSVGYMDPGNWATDLAGGARFGYQLVWVLRSEEHTSELQSLTNLVCRL